MVLHLTESDVERLLDMPTTIAVVEEAFQKLAIGDAENSPRVRVKAPGIVLHAMSAAAGYLGYVGWKQYTTTSAGAKFLVGLHRQSDGELVALIEADRLGQMRTGAVTGVAVKYLADPGADRVGIFGSGWQAETQLAAVAAVKPLRQAIVYSRDAVRRRSFAERMSHRLNLEVKPVASAELAVADLPIVVTATTSRTPVFDGHWLSGGTLLCAVGSNWLNKAEIDATAVSRASRIVCDSIECCRREAGDFVMPLERGPLDWSRTVELSAVVADGRISPANCAEIVLFKSVGMAIEDVAVGAKLMSLATANRPLGER